MPAVVNDQPVQPHEGGCALPWLWVFQRCTSRTWPVTAPGACASYRRRTSRYPLADVFAEPADADWAQDRDLLDGSLIGPWAKP